MNEGTPARNGTSAEHGQLIRQAGLFGPSTERLIAAAGLGPGMRVLVAGCGVGDVAFLCARFVGEEGEVVGMDDDAAALEVARHRAKLSRIENVSFTEGDCFAEPGAGGEPYDAVVGRLVLFRRRDPAGAIQALLPCLRSGGIVAFQEPDWSTSGAVPPCALYERLVGWWRETARQVGMEPGMGLKLHSTFLEAGLPAPRLLMETLAGGGEDFAGYRYVADMLHSVPERPEVAAPAEVEADALAGRLREEVVEGGGCITLQAMVGAWARKP